MSNLHQVDLNLLVALQALLRTRSVTKSALQLNVTQSAMSRTLQRLRALFSDPLLVRSKGGLVTTERAQGLAASLDVILQDIECMLAPATFDPTHSKQQFTMMVTDFFSQVFMPAVYQRVFSQAPNLQIKGVNHQPNMMEMLALGEIDIAFSNLNDPVSSDIYAHKLGDDKLVTLMREGHPLSQEKLSIDQYCQAAHALVTMGGDHLGTVDVVLAKLGYQRHVALRMPHFTAAPHIIAQTDMLLTVPRCLAEHMLKQLDLMMVDPPLQIEAFSYYMVWHARQHNNMAHRWLRQQLQEVFSLYFSNSTGN